MRWQNAWLLALSAAVVLAGCGGGHRKSAPPTPRLPGALGAQLAKGSAEVERLLNAGDSCGARAAALELQTAALRAVQDRRVPSELGEVLLPTINDLVGRIQCTPPSDEKDHGKHQGKKNQKKHKEKDD